MYTGRKTYSRGEERRGSVILLRAHGSLVKPVGTSSFLLALRTFSSVTALVVCS